MSRLSKTSVGKMRVHSLKGMANGMKYMRPRVNSMMMGGDLVPKPKGFGPADIGLVPEKKRKY